jgi:hypothetical protein
MVGKANRLVLSVLAGAASLFGALSIGAMGTPAASAQTMSGDAQLRVLHASPDAPAVDVYVNGSKAISNLAFGEVSSTASLPAGTYDVKVTAAGGTDAVITAKLPLEAGKHYTVVAEGKLANITAKVVEDKLVGLDAGKAQLRVVHASPDAPAVDVAVKGGAVLVPNLAFPNASDYLAVDPMTVDVEIRAAGTNTVALSVPGLTLEAGKVYTVYAIGLLNGTPALKVLPVVDTAIAATTGPAPAPVPSTGGDMGAGSGTAAPGMPATGAGEDLFNLAALVLIMVAAATVATSALVRARNR